MKSYMPRLAEITAVALISIVSCIIFAMNFGQDINWDLLNYHYYSGYSFLNNRLGVDVAPSQQQTWLNPLPSLLGYVLITFTPPRFAAASLAGISSLAVILVFVIARLSLKSERQENQFFSIAIAVLVSVAAFLSPMFMSELGTTFNDSFGASVILAALATLFAGSFSRKSYFLAGLFLGVALALKLTNAFYVIAWVVAVMVVERQRSLSPLFVSGFGAALTYLPFGGIWNIYLYLTYGNPLFPYYNQIFKSDFYKHIMISDDRFKAKNFAQALDYFRQWPIGGHPTSEVVFSDVRFTFIFLLIPLIFLIFLYLWISGKRKCVSVFNSKTCVFILTFCLVAFVFWLHMFGIQRYAVALEMLSPLVIVIMLSFILQDKRILFAAAFAAVLFIGASVVKANWGRLSFTQDWFGVEVPTELRGEGVLFVMLSDAPMAYVIPFLPASDVFVRIEGNLPVFQQTGLEQVINEKISNHRGPIWTLAPAGYNQNGSAAILTQFGLRSGGGNCVEIVTKAGGMVSCQLARVARD